MAYPVTHDAGAQQLTANVDGRRSLLQYRLKGGTMTIVHTEVPPELAGHGIAADLMRAALDMARANGWRVRPACSYAQAFLQKHTEYGDLLVPPNQADAGPPSVA
jgi:predicted GNAT family acetyltransferase